MFVTFNNRFEIAENYEGRQRIHYKHDQNCDLQVYIENAKPQFDINQPPPERDWDIAMEGGNKIIISEYKTKLANDLALYLKRRTHKPIKEISYQEIERLAKIRSVY